VEAHLCGGLAPLPVYIPESLRGDYLPRFVTSLRVWGIACEPMHTIDKTPPEALDTVEGVGNLRVRRYYVDTAGKSITLVYNLISKIASWYAKEPGSHAIISGAFIYLSNSQNQAKDTRKQWHAAVRE